MKRPAKKAKPKTRPTRRFTRAGTGRPPKYDETYIKLAERLVADDWTDLEIARVIGVDPSNLWRWKQRFPAFAKAFERGLDHQVRVTKRSLFHRANGYSHKATKIFLHEGEPVIVEYEEVFPPDVQAQKTFLAANAPEYRPSLQHTGDPLNPVRFTITGLYDSEKEKGEGA